MVHAGGVDIDVGAVLEEFYEGAGEEIDIAAACPAAQGQQVARKLHNKDAYTS